MLRKYPLCSRCLGRLFAKYGLGINNLIRGNAIKVMALMEIHRMISKDIKYVELLREVLPNVGIMPQLSLKYLGMNVGRVKCYICSNDLDLIISQLISKILNKVAEFRVRNFVVSIPRGSEMEQRELEVVTEFNLDSWESIRRELKRELGKKVRALLNIEPEFKHPDLIIKVDLNTLEPEAYVTPTYVLCRYVKIGRYISQMRWISRNGSRKYMLSLEDVVEALASSLGVSRYRMHLTGREDVDARILGSGRPLIVELKGMKDKTLSTTSLSELVANNMWIFLMIDRYVAPKHVVGIKLGRYPVLYRLLTLSKQPLNNDVVELLSREFDGREVKQVLVRRVRGRRKEFTRVGKVYAVRGRLVNEFVLELLIKCDSELFIKELVGGGEGSTSPSFTEVLGTKLEVLEVDLLDVITDY